MNQFYNQHSPLGKLDVRLKIVLSFYLSLVVILVDSLYILSLTAFLGLAAVVASKPGRTQVKLILITIIPLVWGVMISQGIFYNQFPREAIIEFMKPNIVFQEGLKLYIQGIYHGLIQSLRMITMLLVGYAICFSTSPESFLLGLTSLKCPYSFAFMASCAIRFLPITADEFRTVRSALKLKGYKPFQNGLIDTVKTEIATLRPILAATIRRSEDIALSIITRGFSFQEHRTSLYQLKFGKTAWWTVILTGGLVMLISAFKFLFWLYRYEFYYHQSLRPVYSICRHWL